MTARTKAEHYLERALLAPTPLAHRVASAMHGDFRQFAASPAEARRAVALDPNDPEGHIALTWALINAGEGKAAIAAAESAMRLDPYYPATYLLALGMANFVSGRYETAADQLERAYERNPDLHGAQATLAASQAYLGNIEAARKALKIYTESWPYYTPKVDRVMEWRPFEREDDIRHYADGLIKAGLCCEEKLEDYVDRVRRGGTLK